MSGVAIVTGGGSGIGRATALALHQAGWRVVLAGRRPEGLHRTAELARKSERILAVPTDISDPAQVSRLFEQAHEAWTRIDLLFNNAGVSALGVPLDKLTLRQWQTVVDVNLTGTFLCTQQAMRFMKKQSPMGGRIINNGSVSAHSPRPNSAPYTATKHAITGLTKSISLDGRAFNIACGQIDVGNVNDDGNPGTARALRQAGGRVLEEPALLADQVAQAVVYMANLPLDANVQFMTLIPSKMPYVGRG
jgi:NAD(P)-dependent dehydrogenase (short-subunit alcohol dehydrogenase family)